LNTCCIVLLEMCDIVCVSACDSIHFHMHVTLHFFGIIGVGILVFESIGFLKYCLTIHCMLKVTWAL
jgi:hypothetical protein